MPISLRENICKAHKVLADEEVVLRRAELLDRADKDLLEAVMIRGQSATAVARLMGADPRLVRKRVLRVVRRISERLFLRTARVLDFLPPQEARLARMRFCQGLTYREIYRKLGDKPSAVRKRLDRLDAQIDTIERVRQSSAR